MERNEKRRIYLSLTDVPSIMGIPKNYFYVLSGIFLPLTAFTQNIFFLGIFGIIISYLKYLSLNDMYGVELFFNSFFEEKELDA